MDRTKTPPRAGSAKGSRETGSRATGSRAAGKTASGSSKRGSPASSAKKTTGRGAKRSSKRKSRPVNAHTAELRTNLIFIGVLLGLSLTIFTAKLVYTGDSKQGRNAPSVPLVIETEQDVFRTSEESRPVSSNSQNTKPITVSPVLSPIAADTPSGAGAPSGSAAGPPASPAAKSAPAGPSASPAVTPVPAVSSTAAGTSAEPRSVPAASVADRIAKVDRQSDPALGKKKGTLLFVFDDAGHNLRQLEPFLRLPFPCTIAVLPGLQYSREAARMIRAAGKELILHQPMQAINRSLDPGPQAIRDGMSPQQIRTLVLQNLAEVGPVSGINNHEGSLITADAGAMSAVLDVAKEQGLYFLDSRTNAATSVPAVAKKKNMPIWERAVFLDNSQERAEIIEAVYNGMKIADKGKSAVMIGHIWSNNLAGILAEMYPEMIEQGYSLSTIARVATEDGTLE